VIESSSSTDVTLSAPTRGESPLRRRWHVLVALTRADLRVRYGRGVWQVVKWVLDPFALVGVYLLLRVVIFDRGGEAVGLTLACSVVPFQVVLLSCASSLSAVGVREPIVLNMRFDRMLIPLGTVMTEALAFAASFLLFPLMMLVYGVEPTSALLWLPVVIAVTLTLAAGLSYPAALVGLWFPSFKVFAAQALRIAYFASPGLVALSEISDGVRRWIHFNPLTGLFESFRHVFLYGTPPEAWHLLYPALVGLGLAAIFVPVYRHEQRHFAKLVADS
jgi:lipopolysaccharide transport system permease protein